MSLYEKLSLLIQAVIGFTALYFAWRQLREWNATACATDPDLSDYEEIRI